MSDSMHGQPEKFSGKNNITDRTRTRIKYHVWIISVLIISGWNSGFSQSPEALSEDGAWCWFSDPRAIYAGKDGERKIVTGWVTKKGDIVAASLKLDSKEIKTKILYPELEVDDHNNPAFLELPNHEILTQYTWHSGKKGVIQNITNETGDVTTFGEPRVFLPRTEDLIEKYKRETYTYANPIKLAEEGDKIYSFGRWIGYKPNMITSTDGGRTWSDPSVIVTSPTLDTNNRPYVKYFSDGQSRIHIVFTDGHPAVEPMNSVYYCYYENGAFWKVNGEKICGVEELPFHPEDATVVYQATEEKGRSWIFDITADDKGFPVIVYSRYPRLKVHDYYYSRWDGERWHDHKIVYSGAWFPEDFHGKTQREVNYSGGMVLDPMNPSVVYFSHVIDGVFEISKGETSDYGRRWKITPVTRNSTSDNVRPFVPRYRNSKDKNIILWMQNRSYVHWSDYDSRILYQIAP